MPLPDYQGGSIVNLMTSLVSALGTADTVYPPLRRLAPTLLSRRNVVLIVVDGLGYEYLVRAGGGGVLCRYLDGPITSVFPATTATAITTFLTGTAPQQHALTGWHMYFKELGCVTAVLPFRARHGGPPLVLAGVDAHGLFGHRPVFDRLAARAYVVAPERIMNSDFNMAHTGTARRRPYTTLVQFFDTIAGLVRGNSERKYVYAYYPELDRLAHDLGINSTAATDHLAELDTAFGVFLDRISGTDTAVIVTADHGFIDSSPEHSIDLDQHPGLAETLVLPLCGERRVAYCYVRPDACARFEDYVLTHFADCLDLHRSAQLVDEGYFGIGTPHPRLADRIGDYTLIMRDNYVMKDWLAGEHRYNQIGVHGGISADEMHVPLVVASV